MSAPRNYKWHILVAILALVVSASLAQRRPSADGRLQQCKVNLKSIGTALEIYSTDNSGRYPTSLTALLPKYLVVIPRCPNVASDSYVAEFGPGSPRNPDKYQDFYYLCCRGENHRDASVTGDFPGFSSTHGVLLRAP